MYISKKQRNKISQNFTCPKHLNCKINCFGAYPKKNNNENIFEILFVWNIRIANLIALVQNRGCLKKIK